jgi:hypothetical protein
VVALILQVRREREYNAPRKSASQRYRQVYVSPPTNSKNLKRHEMRRIGQKRLRPGREIKTPGHSLQIDVTLVPKRLSGWYRFYQIHRDRRSHVLSGRAALRPQEHEERDTWKKCAAPSRQRSAAFTRVTGGDSRAI